MAKCQFNGISKDSYKIFMFVLQTEESVSLSETILATLILDAVGFFEIDFLVIHDAVDFTICVAAQILERESL